MLVVEAAVAMLGVSLVGVSPEGVLGVSLEGFLVDSAVAEEEGSILVDSILEEEAEADFLALTLVVAAWEAGAWGEWVVVNANSASSINNNNNNLHYTRGEME